MTPRHPNTDRTLKLPASPNQGKQNPIKSTTKPAPRPTALHLPRPQAERLLALADFLPAADAILLREVLSGGRTLAHLARMLKANRHTLRTRIARLIARASSPEFAFVVARRIGLTPARGTHARTAPHKLRWPDDWSEPMRITAQLCILDGLSLRDAAAHSGVSYHTLRRHQATLRELGRMWRTSLALREAS